jgi:hypothetical protein
MGLLQIDLISQTEISFFNLTAPTRVFQYTLVYVLTNKNSSFSESVAVVV